MASGSLAKRGKGSLRGVCQTSVVFEDGADVAGLIVVGERMVSRCCFGPVCAGFTIFEEQSRGVSHIGDWIEHGESGGKLICGW